MGCWLCGRGRATFQDFAVANDLYHNLHECRPFWTATIDIKQGTSREFKFAISRKGGGLDYEDGKNRVVPLKAGDVVAFLEG